MSVKCLICNNSFNKLVPAHIKTHNLTVAQYRARFPLAIFTDIDVKSYIQKANNIHNNKYDYSLSTFNRSTDKIKIICPQHGIFHQQLNSHIDSRQGCPKCSHNFAFTHDNFCNKSKEKYSNKFSIMSTYQGMKHPIKIICEKHGMFKLNKAESHLVKDGGCPDCWYLTRLDNLKPGNISKLEDDWLNSLGVPLRQYKVIIKDKTFLVDGFDPASETVYEYYGSFWHGNPLLYNKDELNTVTNTTFGELYQKTMLREDLLRERFRVVSKWG